MVLTAHAKPTQPEMVEASIGSDFPNFFLNLQAPLKDIASANSWPRLFETVQTGKRGRPLMQVFNEFVPWTGHGDCLLACHHSALTPGPPTSDSM